MRGFLVFVAALALGGRLPAETFESGEAQTALLELFTSEGCSSCPAADRQFARLRDDSELWKTVVPVGFHVDYWDGLGRPDPFARAEFTRRQRDYATLWGTRTVYTPDFVINGRDGRGSEGSARPGKLRAEVQAGGEVVVTFQPAGEISGPVVAVVAPLAGSVVSQVRRGENAGHQLAHEFVALALVSSPLEEIAGAWTANLSLPTATEVPAAALAVWIHRGDEPTPLRATGGWLVR